MPRPPRMGYVSAFQVGPVDILINNAAVVNCQELLALEPNRVRRNFEVNTLSHIWVSVYSERSTQTVTTPILVKYNSIMNFTLEDAKSITSDSHFT